ncbi:MAG: SUMF1/EgtB/PvdO family nonheme iron enzyme [Desulfobacteraceae bacterium]|nr:SUMF1/EgtB/PvdO family nonheme iron enzyme [Desulfobacteraceae bacterium]
MARYAILIASSQFPEEQRLEALRFPGNDVKGLDEILSSEDYGHFDETFVFENKPDSEVRRRINRTLREAGKDDMVLIYYSGHGKLNDTGHLYLATTNTVMIELESTSISVNEIKSFMDVSSSRKKVLILDCCYSGAVDKIFTRLRGGVDDQLQMISRGQGTCIMTASTGIQAAVEKEADKHGVFTKHIIEGIRTGKADLNKDGWITTDELYRYVYEHVCEGGCQEPMKWDLNIRGELVIAKSRKFSDRQEKIRDMLLDLARNRFFPDNYLAHALTVNSGEISDMRYARLLERFSDNRLEKWEFVADWRMLAESGKAGESAQVQESGEPEPESLVDGSAHEVTITDGTKVFISCANEDIDIAARLYGDLEKAGVIPWMDKNILAGQNRKLEIRKAIQESAYFLMLLSKNSVTKTGYFQKELKIALEMFDERPDSEIFLIPALLDECKPEDERIQDIQHVDLGADYEGGLNDILRVLCLGRETAEPGKPAEMKKEVSEPVAKKDEPAKYRERIINSIGMEFVLIQPGTFMMGSPEDEPERVAERETQHEVTLTKAFYMQTTQVTQGQWMTVMGKNPSSFKNGDDYPVESVSWNDAQEFIKKLNEKESVIYRFPTEAEWEYSCRSGTDTPFFFGRCLSTDQANYDGNYPMEGCPKGEYRKRTTPVASFEPNAWGLYDMHGNVWEWCRDWFDNYPSSAVTDPVGPDTGSDRVLRGGSWDFDAWFCRTAYRNWFAPGFGGRSYGFRLVLLPGQQVTGT